MAVIHPHCHIVASNDQFGNFVATDIASGNVKQLLPKCCHAIAGKYIASNDKLFGNVKSDIAGDFVATPCPLGDNAKTKSKSSFLRLVLKTYQINLIDMILNP